MSSESANDDAGVNNTRTSESMDIDQSTKQNNITKDITKPDTHNGENKKIMEKSSTENSEIKMKKHDSGIYIEKSQNDVSDEGESEKNANIGQSNEASGHNSPDSGHQDSSFSIADDSKKMDISENCNESSQNEDEGKNKNSKKPTAVNEDSDDEFLCTKNENGTLKVSSDEEEYDPTPKTERPKHKWFLCQEVVNRQYGISNRYSNDWFRIKSYSSLHMIERLELMYKMKKHDGCVNSLHFNSTGTQLASGSDDLSIVIWDWAISDPILVYDSGHRSNVFQAKFMPLSGDCHIISCARDGQVRLAELSSTGVCKGTRKLAQHRGAAHKLSLIYDTPHTFLTCGEDAAVFEVDLRGSKPETLVVCEEDERKVPLYSIFVNPSNSCEFAVGGRDHFVRVYDKRFIQGEQGTLRKFCPHHLVNSDIRANVTCLVYNYNGSEILASYNDEDIYTFDSRHSDGAEYTHRYRGHRNNQTVKGVNYFGPKSDYIISGSDCGYIFFWEHDSEHIVHCMYGDEGGVVNCLEPHPSSPFLATSGLDDDVKIWVPSCEHPPDLTSLKTRICNNMKEREEERKHGEPDNMDGEMLWFLLQHLQRTAQRRAQREGRQPETSSNSSDTEDEDEAEPSTGIQCSQS